MIIHRIECVRKIVSLHGVRKQEVIYTGFGMIFINQIFLLSINRFGDDE